MPSALSGKKSRAILQQKADNDAKEKEIKLINKAVREMQSKVKNELDAIKLKKDGLNLKIKEVTLRINKNQAEFRLLSLQSKNEVQNENTLPQLQDLELKISEDSTLKSELLTQKHDLIAQEKEIKDNARKKKEEEKSKKPLIQKIDV